MKIDLVSDLVYSLIRKDKEQTERAFASCLANEKEGQVKNRLKKMLDEYHRREGMAVIEKLDVAIQNLIYAPYRDCSFNDLFFTDEILSETKKLLLEWENKEYLIENGLVPANKILLGGPPGNGKTSYAIALAKKLNLPLLNTSSSMMLDSYLGKSEKNVSLLFHKIPEECVLFFDEFESMASTRGRVSNDSGGAGRAWNSIVTSFLVNMESLHPSCLFIAATNRVDMLDKAVVRRFDMQLELKNPTEKDKIKYIEMYLAKYGLDKSKFITEDICNNLNKAVSYSDVETLLKKKHKEFVINTILKRSTEK